MTTDDPVAPPPDDPRATAMKRFDAIRGQLDERLDVLLVCEPHTLIKTPGIPHVPVPATAGVYLFTEQGQHQYVGRSKTLKSRFGNHTRPSSGENSAPFAFNIAKRAAEDDGFEVAGRTRKQLATDPKFAEKYFTPAKGRVRAMEFRYVEFNPDDADADAFSTIFEVYAAIALGTDSEFNLFGTH
jgi:hypothetical protein